jgi:GDPmannose 4,6-dehydratase
MAFAHAGVDLDQHLSSDPNLFRPAEVHTLVGDAELARQELGWQARVSLEELIGMMVDADLARLNGG